MTNTIFMTHPAGLARDLANARLMHAFPRALLRFGPQASLEISYETESESKSAVIHEAANVVRALMAETDSISVTAAALDALDHSSVLWAEILATHHSEGIPFFLRTVNEAYACVFGAAAVEPEA